MSKEAGQNRLARMHAVALQIATNTEYESLDIDCTAVATHHLFSFSKVSLTRSTALYTKCSCSGRPHQVWKHEAGYSRDSLLFEEENPRCVHLFSLEV